MFWITCQSSIHWQQAGLHKVGVVKFENPEEIVMPFNEIFHAEPWSIVSYQRVLVPPLKVDPMIYEQLGHFVRWRPVLAANDTYVSAT